MTGELWLEDIHVGQLLWMAHNKIFIPHVEEERATSERLELGESIQCRDIGFTTSLAKSRGRFFPCSARQ
jgi:hypothetical protein